MSAASSSYDRETARRYAAFRPPLHEMIVRRLLQGRRFDRALDVGCGAGRSTVALAPYCASIIGVDASAAMLAEAAAHPKIVYRLGDAAAPPIDAEDIDLVSLAGVLPYVDAPALLVELRRVCRRGADVIVYDFRVELEDLLAKASLHLAPSASPSTYNHAANLSGAPMVSTRVVGSERATFDASPSQAAHLVLASEARRDALAALLGDDDPHDRLAARFGPAERKISVDATMWWAAHTLGDRD